MNRGKALRFLIDKAPHCLSIFALLGCWVFMTSAVSAQRTTGQIAGTVTDQSGAAVGGATVTASRPQINLTRSVQTTSDGNYAIPDLPAGVYSVSIS